MSFKEELIKIGWEEVKNPDKNNGWRQFVGWIPIAFNNKSEEEILENLKALTPEDGKKITTNYVYPTNISS